MARAERTIDFYKNIRIIFTGQFRSAWHCRREGETMGRHGENIRKRKDGRWEGRYKIYNGKKGKMLYRSVYGRSYGEVKEKLSKAKLGADVQKPENLPQNANDCQGKGDNSQVLPLFSQAAEEWLKEISKTRKYSTYVKYSMVYKTHLAGNIGSCQLSATASYIWQEKIFDYISKKSLSESLQKSIFYIANQILGFANQKYFTDVPLLRMPEKPLARPKKNLASSFSKAEQGRLLGCIYQSLDKFSVAVLLCLYTGVRLGELCALQWADLDLSDMTLTVNQTVQRIAVGGHETKTILLETDPKSESSKRNIPLTGEIIKHLVQLKGNHPYVFGGKKPLDPRTMQYRFKKMLKQAEIDGRNFHILRHTFATNCVENSMDVKALSEILGHSDVKITLNRYVHPTMDLKRKQMESLLDFYGQIYGQAA